MRGPFGRRVTAVAVDGVPSAPCDPADRYGTSLAVPACSLTGYSGRFDHAVVEVAMTEPSGAHVLEVTAWAVIAATSRSS